MAVKKLGIQDDYGDEVVNEVLSFDASETASEIAESVIGGARDLLARAAGSKEYTGRFEAELLSARPFFLALGSLALSSTESPYTVKVCSTLPFFTVKSSDEYGNDISYSTCVVESLRFALEVGEDVTYELSFRGRGVGTDSPGGTATIPTPFVYYDGSVNFGGAIGSVQTCEVEITNDLTDVFEIGTQAPIDISEGPVGVSGRMVVNNKAFSVGDSGSLTVTMKSTDLGTLKVILKDIEVMERAHALDPTDPTSFEYPFTAKGVTGYDIMRVIDTTGNSIGAALY